MRLFALEHSKVAYLADFVLYGIAVLALAALLWAGGPAAQRGELAAIALLGFVGWTLIEYVLHRFVLHWLQPFKRWHMVHHQHPAALICTPTILSASLIVLLVFLPALLLGDIWRACALTLGLVTGYLVYALLHHALHHGHPTSKWLKKRQHWHALHHRPSQRSDCFGVTTEVWDHVFGTAFRAGAGKDG